MPTTAVSDRFILAAARRVVSMEEAALRALKGAVGPSFAAAVRLMASRRGKVVVTGIGKSGLIAQKIAATLASTGTPSIYLHPAEALHGSLGMVQRQDVVLAIGKSGESEELNSLLPALRRIGAPLIALTASPKSALARHAKVLLVTPLKEEACPLNLAPTCSTTAALAAGDALAVALMRLRGFDREQFALLHPGGQLGRRLTTRVRDIMQGGRENPVIRVDAGVPAMLVEITRKQAGAVSVVDPKGRLVGLVTDFDLRRFLQRGEDVRRKDIREIMSRKPLCAHPEMLVTDALTLMLRRKKPFALLPVVDARRRAVGMIHLHDIRKLGLGDHS